MKLRNILVGLNLGLLAGLFLLLITGSLYSIDYEIVKSYDISEKVGMSSYILDDFNPKYGAITLTSKVLGIETGKVAEYSLTSIKEDLVDIAMFGKVTLYERGTLFDDVNFKDISGNLYDLEGSYYIEKTLTKIVDVPNYENVCSEVLDKNTSESKEICALTITSYKQESQIATYWELYDSKQELNPGNYNWKYEAKRIINQKIDIIPIKYGNSFSEWVWFNSSWSYYQSINITNNMTDLAMLNMTTINMTIDTQTLVNSAKMQNDCDDLRVVFNDTLELNRLVESCNSTTSKIVFGMRNNISENMSDTTNYKIYYGNSLATNPPVNDNLSNIYIFKSTLKQNDGGWINGSTLTFDANGLSFTNPAPYRRLETGVYRNITWTDNIQIRVSTTIGGVASWLYIGTRAIGGVDYAQMTGGQRVNARTSYIVNGSATIQDTNQGLNYGDFNNFVLNYKRGVFNGSDGISNTIQRNYHLNPTLSVFSAFNGDGASSTLQNLTIRSNFYNEPKISLLGETSNVNPSLTIILSAPVTNFNTTDSTPTLYANFSSIDQNITSIVLKVYNASNYLSYNYTNSSLPSASMSLNYSWTTSSLSDGTYNWSFSAYGSSGINSTSSNRTFNIDTTPPTQTINSPVSDYRVNSFPVNVTMNVSTLGALACWYRNATGLNVSYTCNTIFNYSVSIPSSHDFIFYANDSLGNLVTSPISFSVGCASGYYYQDNGICALSYGAWLGVGSLAETNSSSLNAVQNNGSGFLSQLGSLFMKYPIFFIVMIIIFLFFSEVKARRR